MQVRVTVPPNLASVPEVEQVASAFLLEATGRGSKVNGKITAGLGPAKKRYRDRPKHAQLREDRIELDELEIFRKNTTSFLSIYDFSHRTFATLKCQTRLICPTSS